MTEKDLRESLKTYLAPADLPDSRKQALLAQIREEAAPAPEKGDTNMFRPNKFRTVMLVAAIVTLLSFTVALAAGFSGYVNIKGEPVDTPTLGYYPEPTATPTDAALDKKIISQKLIDESPRDLLAITVYVDETGRQGSSNIIREPLTSLEQLADYLPEGVPLPTIPEGFSFHSGQVSLICAGDSDYELVNTTVTGSGVTLFQYRIPEGKAVLHSSDVLLLDDADRSISFCVRLNPGHYDYFEVDENTTMETITIPGMDDALLLVRPDMLSLNMRVVLDPPIEAREMPSSHGSNFNAPRSYDEISFSLLAWSNVTAETLLDMYK